jgi:uncharacterized protein (TIGR00159 family)
MLDPFFEIRFTDVVDILLVTVLLYTAIVWIRRTQAALVAGGILILGILYLVAEALELRLISWIFQGFFAIFLVIIVVIFQEELRQLFERVAMWGLRRRNARPQASDHTDVLVRCLSDFAKDRIGALVVLPGTQPLQRHLQGGVGLGGALSVPLLKSIFDPHSAGHDGAVLVEDGQVSRFAVHLPLSKDFAQLSGVGTRHSAALGLAELTDALCLVVSEERGKISIARDGKLREVQSSQELGALIQEHLRATHPTKPRRPLSIELLRENWAEKAAALVLVVGLWYLFVPGSRPTQITYEVPVNVASLPSKLVLENVDPPKIRVTFSGMARDFYLFEPKGLQVTVDASLAQIGRRTFAVSEQNLRYPKELRIEKLNPAKVRISVRKAKDEAEGAESRAPSDVPRG